MCSAFEVSSALSFSKKSYTLFLIEPSSFDIALLFDAMTRFATYITPFDFNTATICSTSAGHSVQPAGAEPTSKVTPIRG